MYFPQFHEYIFSFSHRGLRWVSIRGLILANSRVSGYMARAYSHGVLTSISIGYISISLIGY